MRFAVITTGLLPHGVQEAVHMRSVSADSQSYAVVAFGLMVVLLVEWEALRLVGRGGARRAGILASCGPLLVVFSLTVAARLALLIH